MSQTSTPPVFQRVRSNNLFQKDGLRKRINYEICLSTSRNPDFVVRHPNEMQGKNADWKKEIIKRVNHEEEVRLKMLAVRLAKKTGKRRIDG